MHVRWLNTNDTEVGRSGLDWIGLGIGLDAWCVCVSVLGSHALATWITRQITWKAPTTHTHTTYYIQHSEAHVKRAHKSAEQEKSQPAASNSRQSTVNSEQGAKSQQQPPARVGSFWSCTHAKSGLNVQKWQPQKQQLQQALGGRVENVKMSGEKARAAKSELLPILLFVGTSCLL